MSALLALGMLLAGCVLMLLAAVGVVRMPDVFTRMQATSKAVTLGQVCMMLAVALAFGTPGAWLRAGAIALLFLLTAPVAAHAIGRAAYFTGSRLWSGSVRDDLRGRYDGKTHSLRGG